MKRSILVVEDSATQAEALRSLLVAEKYEVEVARSGEAAMEILAGPPVAIIMSDIVMPGMNGFDLCRSVKADPRTREIPFVLLTSLTDPMDIIRGLECGADNYITKPYDPDHLLARLRHVLDNRRLRHNSKTSLGVSVRFLGHELAINSEKEQILDLFISSVEDVVRANEALEASRAELTRAHEQLAAYAQEKSREARISTERYRTLLKNASDAIFVLDAKGSILELNRQAATLLGGAGTEAVGTGIAGYIPVAQRASFIARFANLPRNGQVDLGVIELDRGRDAKVLIDLSASMSHLEGEDLILLIARDVTERQRQAERLDDANQRLTTLIEASPLAIIVLDREMTVELWNGAAEQLFGWTSQEILNRAYPLVPSTREETSRELVQSVFRGESLRGLELPMNRRDGGTVEVSVYAVPLLGHGRETARILLVMADVTERREAEKAFQERAQAEQANRAKSEFLSRMSHELRTPLNAILGFAQLLELDQLDADQRESVGQILRGGRHLLDLINEVLDLSRIEAGRLVISLEPVTIGTALKHAMDLVAPLAAEMGLSLDAEKIDPALHVAADVQRLRQVLLNLLSNAVKYNRRDGTVRVNVETRDEWVRVTVRDSGMGIPENQIERLFSPFERLGADGSGIQGTGLGLVLARALTEAMGGRIGVESELGRGSSFWIELPRAAETAIAEQVSQLHVLARPAVGPKRSILYIEDNPSNLRLVERVLSSREEIQLISAMHGSLGIELAEKHRPDLVLLDLNLPDMMGEEVLRRLRITPGLEDTPVVIVSADAIPAQAGRFMELGASAYLTKPFDVRNLLRVVDELLEKTSQAEGPRRDEGRETMADDNRMGEG